MKVRQTELIVVMFFKVFTVKAWKNTAYFLKRIRFILGDWFQKCRTDAALMNQNDRRAYHI